MSFFKSSPKPEAVQELLDDLAQVRTRLTALDDLIRQKMQADPEIGGMLELQAELKGQKVNLEEGIKEMVLELEATVKGERLQAVYAQPSKRWDSKGLQGYAVANPEVLAFLKTGSARVSIRKA